MRSWDHIPPSYYWIVGDLFRGGPLQGFVGNRNPLAFIALLALMCFLVQCAEEWYKARRIRSDAAIWSGVAIAFLVLTRSATVAVAVVACLCLFFFALFLRSFPLVKRRFWARAALTAFASFALVGIVMHEQVTQLIGRSSDFTGRGIIWEKLLELWNVHPFEGWGWLVIWPPWLPLFKNLVVRPDGTPTMQAHNSYIEALFQTGLIGLMFLTFAVMWVMIRMLRVAVRTVDGDLMPLLAAVLMVALFVQSFAESRLLTEGNWVLFVAFATWLKVRTESYVVNPKVSVAGEETVPLTDVASTGLPVSLPERSSENAQEDVREEVTSSPLS